MAVVRKHVPNGREPLCPHCGKKITVLKYNTDRHCWERGTPRITQEGLDVEDEHEDGTGDIDFTCPYCEEMICYDEDEAEQFLRTGKLSDQEDSEG
jgi:hypothetical protein